MFCVTITHLTVSIQWAPSDEISLTVEETVWAGNLITFARWTENDHCDCNKAVTCLPEKTTRGSPQRFELEKRRVKTPPVCLALSLMWSHFTHRPCYVHTCSIICISHGHKNNFHVPPPPPTDMLQLHFHFPLMKFCPLKQLFSRLSVQLEAKWRPPISKSQPDLKFAGAKLNVQCISTTNWTQVSANPFHHATALDEWKWT